MPNIFYKLWTDSFLESNEREIQDLFNSFYSSLSVDTRKVYYNAIKKFDTSLHNRPGTEMIPKSLELYFENSFINSNNNQLVPTMSNPHSNVFFEMRQAKGLFRTFEQQINETLGIKYINDDSLRGYILGWVEIVQNNIILFLSNEIESIVNRIYSSMDDEMKERIWNLVIDGCNPHFVYRTLDGVERVLSGLREAMKNEFKLSKPLTKFFEEHYKKKAILKRSCLISNLALRIVELRRRVDKQGLANAAGAGGGAKEKYLKYKHKYLNLKNNLRFTQYGGAAGGAGGGGGFVGLESLSLWNKRAPPIHGSVITTTLDKNSKILEIGDIVLLPPNIEDCIFSIGTLDKIYTKSLCGVKTADGQHYYGPCSDLKIFRKLNQVPAVAPPKVVPVPVSSFTLQNADYNYGSQDKLDIKTKDKDSKEISIGSNVLLPISVPGNQYRWGKLHGTRNNGRICIVKTQDGKLFWGPCSELQSS